MNRPALPLIAALVAALAAGGWFAWRAHESDAVPAGFARANGRVEANQVDVATKFAGRVVEVLPHEGDMVEAGAVVARLERMELEAELRQAQAEALRARQALVAEEAAVRSRAGELAFAEQELQRAQDLVERGHAPRERLDQRRQQLTTAEALLRVANALVNRAQSAIVAADAHVDRLQAALAEATIRAPIRGRVQHRLIEPGAVLPPGGKIVVLLDLSDVTMTIFLPARDAGRLAIGDEARVVLDAAPQHVFGAKVSFVAADAQFTPKAVETAAEREQLMFRVKLQAPPEFLRTIEDRVKSGLRGVAYVRVERGASWPSKLDLNLPK